MAQVTKDDALKIAGQIIHPAIDRSLLDLGSYFCIPVSKHPDC